MKISTYNLNDRRDVSDLICEADNIELIEKPNYWEVIITIDNYYIVANSRLENTVWVKSLLRCLYPPDKSYMPKRKSPLLYAQVVTDIVDGYLTMEE